MDACFVSAPSELFVNSSSLSGGSRSARATLWPEAKLNRNRENVPADCRSSADKNLLVNNWIEQRGEIIPADEPLVLPSAVALGAFEQLVFVRDFRPKLLHREIVQPRKHGRHLPEDE